MSWTAENLPLTFKFILDKRVNGEMGTVFHGVVRSKNTVEILWKDDDEILFTSYNLDLVVEYLNNKDWIMEAY